MRPRLPFQRLSAENWQNLAIAGLIVFYAAQVVLDISWQNFCGHLGIDFCAFWSAGHVANQHSYSAVYDLQKLAELQRPLLPARAGADGFRVIPIPYLPVFILPFQLLALLPAPAAGAIWILFNIAGTLLYLRRFASRTGDRPPATRLLVMVVVSAPVFLNLFTGQVNLWLMICIGEFLVASMSGRGFRSGLWLGGLLLKPQSLVLLVPALLIQRSTRTALGLVSSGAALLGASWLLAGRGALLELAGLWVGYAGGLPTNDPQLMMNWRMIGSHAANIAGPLLGAVVMAVGMIVTAVAAIALWIRPFGRNVSRFLVATVALIAATTVVAWHAHVHMAMILIPPLLLLAQRRRGLLHGALEWWVFLPTALYFIRLALASMIHAEILGGDAYSLLDFLAGAGAFAMNLYLVGWALAQLKPWKPREWARQAAHSDSSG
jgi:hypothetical protein